MTNNESIQIRVATNLLKILKTRAKLRGMCVSTHIRDTLIGTLSKTEKSLLTTKKTKAVAKVATKVKAVKLRRKTKTTTTKGKPNDSTVKTRKRAQKLKTSNTGSVPFSTQNTSFAVAP